MRHSYNKRHNKYPANDFCVEIYIPVGNSVCSQLRQEF